MTDPTAEIQPDLFARLARPTVRLSGSIDEAAAAAAPLLALRAVAPPLRLSWRPSAGRIEPGLAFISGRTKPERERRRDVPPKPVNDLSAGIDRARPRPEHAEQVLVNKGFETRRVRGHQSISDRREWPTKPATYWPPGRRNLLYDQRARSRPSLSSPAPIGLPERSQARLPIALTAVASRSQ
jgi:hypothetical protein